jgi:hypothetical protein
MIYKKPMLFDETRNSGAVFSSCGQYRYRLWRELGAGEGMCLFIMLNPSTADEFANDPTVERCQRRAAAWGYLRLEVCNIFALRSTDPKALYRHESPVGPDNCDAIAEASASAKMVVCAWGSHGKHLGQSQNIRDLLSRYAPGKTHYLKLNADGEPAHPLYLAYSMQPKKWEGGDFMKQKGKGGKGGGKKGC